MTEAQSSLAEFRLDVWNALMPMAFSLLGSVIIYLMYQMFYGSKHIGAGVHKAFLIGGPAVTALFLAIHTSIPLSVGLLGALSFVRFRTPIKDPAEIGFLLLLMASSIGAAVNNYSVTTLLLVTAFAVLGVQWLARNRVTIFGTGYLMISVDRLSYPELESILTGFLRERVRGLRLETMSTVDDRVGLHYHYRRQRDFDWAAFANELGRLAGDARLELYVS